MNALGYVGNFFSCCCGRREKLPDAKSFDSEGQEQDEIRPMPEPRGGIPRDMTKAEGKGNASLHLAHADECHSPTANATARYFYLLGKSMSSDLKWTIQNESDTGNAGRQESVRDSASPDVENRDDTINSIPGSRMGSTENILQLTTGLKPSLESETSLSQTWEKDIPLVRSELMEGRH